MTRAQRWLGQGVGFGLPTLAGLGLAILSAGSLVAQDPTYAKDVAPIMQRTCQNCHRPGTVAPFSLLTYEDAQRFAPLIKDRVASRQMPPWPMDKSVGIQQFKNDISLSDDEIATIVAWVDAGAPRGNPADEPPARVFPPEGSWAYETRFGRPPDLVIRSPGYVVTANGMDQWPSQDIKVTGLATPRWIRAVEIRPGDPRSRYVFHHANPSLRQGEESTGLIESAVGKEGEIYPDDTGKLIKPDATVEFGMHFYPIGEDVNAVMELALWFYPEGERPEFETPGQVQFRADQSTGAGTGGMGHSRQIARRSDLVIPPNGYAMYQGTYVLDKNVRIHDLRGHMHQRGMYQVVQAIYPDGKRELLNKLNWDHAWHTTFIYEDDARPLLPKGTVLIFTSVFDNTANNHHNADPSQWVVAGSRTVDEMSHVWVGLTYLDDASFERMMQERQRRIAAN